MTRIRRHFPAWAALILTASLWQQAAPAQAQQADRPDRAPVPTVVASGYIEWIDRAALASARDGILEKVEKTIGMEVQEGERIAFLDDTMAQLTFEKARLVADDRSELASAEAQKELALANMARAERLKEIQSMEEYEVTMAQLKVAYADVEKANAATKQAQKELELAQRAVDEHVITAPFDGKILEVLKTPGEAVQAMEPVVHLGRTDRLRFFGNVPYEVSYQLREGMVVDVTPSIEGADLPIEHKRFRGKIVYISPEVAGSGRRSEVQIKADIVNNAAKELRVGSNVEMTIYVSDDPNLIPPPPEDMLPVENPPEPDPRPALSRRPE